MAKATETKKRKRLHNTLEITSIELAERLKECDIVMIPCGSHERHGRHLPLGTDTYHAIEITKLAAEKADVFYTPPLWCGYSPHHMRRPGEGTGTITLRSETYRRVYYDIGKCLIYHGFNKIVYVIYHGSNMKVLDEVMRRLRYETGAFICAYLHVLERDTKLVKDLFKSPPEDIPAWHASEAETSMIMANYPDLVRMEDAVKDFAHAPKWLTNKFSKKDGTGTVEFEGLENIWIPMEHYEYSDSATIGNPFTATPEEGKALIERIATNLANFCNEIKKIKVEVKTREFDERAW
jgi:creatinine amidohydrolase